MVVVVRRDPCSTSRRCSAFRARGFTLVEAAVSTVLVGVMLVAALNTVGAARLGERKIGERSRGMLLAQQLMAEILQQSYEEPDDTPGFGRESSEGGGDRAKYDDVDDYDAWDASPPEDKDGSEIPNLDAWRRSVTVVWVQPTDLLTFYASDTQTKRITVTVTRGGALVAELAALKTVGLPPPMEGLEVLFVVTNVDDLTDQESARSTLIESWGYVVTLIEANDLQSDFDDAVANADVAYVSEEISDSDLGTKLASATIGVVNEDPELIDEFGFGNGPDYTSASNIRIDVNTHYITSPFTTGWRDIYSSSQPVSALTLSVAPGFQPLAYTTISGPLTHASLVVLDLGADLYGGGTAAGRRVLLPWGADAFDFSTLNADGQTIMQRALEWAANREAAINCGNGTCDAGEDSCSCSGDCGTPAAFEAPGATCADGLDNDCDGQTDCDDINCGADPDC